MPCRIEWGGCLKYSFGNHPLAALKGGGEPPKGQQHNKEQEQDQRAPLQGLSHSYLELSSRERCEGEYGKVPDLSVVFSCLYLDEHLYLNVFFRFVSVRDSYGIKSFV